jgi:hypothetical protein
MVICPQCRCDGARSVGRKNSDIVYECAVCNYFFAVTVTDSARTQERTSDRSGRTSVIGGEPLRRPPTNPDRDW